MSAHQSHPELMTDADLLSRIERHLEASGQSPSEFGRAVAKDHKLVRSIREGRSVSLTMANKILAHIDGHTPDPARIEFPEGERASVEEAA